MNCLRVSNHAVDRYIERVRNINPERAIDELISLCNMAKPAELKKKFRSIALLQHNFKECKYFKDNNFVYVVINECIITVHGGDADRWVYEGEESKKNK